MFLQSTCRRHIRIKCPVPDTIFRGNAVNAEELRALQAPLKAQYKENAAAALVTLKARGQIGAEEITCKVETGKGAAVAGLHSATGGDGAALCSGDMLLEALV